ncbi:Transposon Tf2-9 poly, partial [Paramuricea clavata]
QRWRKWIKSFEYYIAASGINDKKQQRAILLHLAGPEVQDIFETLEDTGNDLDTAIAKLTSYFEPQKNIPFERHNFRQTTQLQGETIEQLAIRLKHQVKFCEYGNPNDMIRDQIIEHCSSSRLRRRLLREPELTLEKTVEIGRSFEASERQASQIEADSLKTTDLGVNAIRSKAASSRYPTSIQTGRSNIVCYCCGNAGHRAKDPRCPAEGMSCNKCDKLGHFARVCRQLKPTNKPEFQNPTSKNKNEIYKQNTGSHGEIRYVYGAPHPATGKSLSDDEYVFELGATGKMPHATVQIGNFPVDLIVDSGATVNVLDNETFAKIKANSPITLSKTNLKLFPYGSSTPLSIQGSFTAQVSHKDLITNAIFIVVANQNSGSLLGHKTATDLGLFQEHENFHPIQNICNGDNLFMQTLVTKYPQVFNGIGKLKDLQLHLHFDESVPPVAQAPRRIPFHIRKAVQTKLDELETLGIIEPVKGPSPWVSPLVAVPKPNGDIRVCVDMRQANSAIIRERHPIPTIEETLQELQGATVFSKLDLRSAYHQIELHPESRPITTFATQKGLYQYTRLMFGVSSAPEVYQHIIQQILQGLPGVRNISDDIIVFGKTKDEHDQNLNNVIQRLQESGLTLNKDKCLFGVSNLTFFGHEVSASGVSPDTKKVEAIREARVPTNAAEVRSFLGLATYCSRFVPNFATVADPLRLLTRKSTPWQWNSIHQNAFDTLKNLLTGNTVMAHYDPSAPTHLRVDASPVGLGAMLTQTQHGITKPIAYASRTLSNVERRYSQTEKEALAVVWGCEKFHLYLYGTEFTIYTDHKPLEIIYNPKRKPPARIERWALRLQPYHFKIQYIPGAENPADVLSRLPLPHQPHVERSIADEYVNYIVSNSVPKAMTLEQIEKASLADPILQRIHTCITSGTRPKEPDLRPYMQVNSELCVQNGIILRGTRIVIPFDLQKPTLELAHQGHQGIVKTKQLLRQKVWWPGIDKDVDKMISQCLPCQAQGPKTNPEPLHMSTMPTEPWHTLHIDLCGPFPTGESLLVLVDACSRWPAVEILSSTTATTIINRLENIFSQFGYPEEMVSDNGPQFTSHEFKSFLHSCGIKHRLITPYWPAANATVERFNKTSGKAVKAAHAEGRNWKQELPKFLMMYRATPHISTGVSPAELFFGRRIKTKLPHIRVASQCTQ